MASLLAAVLASPPNPIFSTLESQLRLESTPDVPNPIFTRSGSKAVQCIAWLSSDRIVAGSHKTLRIWNLTNSTKEGVSMDHPGPLSSVVTTKDGRIITCCRAEQHLMLWDAKTQELISEPSSSENYGPAEWMIMSPNEDILASSHERWIVFWEMTGTSIQVRNCIDPNSIAGFKTAVTAAYFATSACFSPDGKRIVICFKRASITVLDVESGDRIYVIDPFDPNSVARLVESAIWSTDGARIFCACALGLICCLDSSTGELIGKPWREHLGDVICLSTSPDGKYLASGGWEGAVCLWDAESGNLCREPFHGHYGSVVHAVSFSPSGEFIACGGDKGKVSVWRVPWWDNDDRKDLTGNPLLNLSAVVPPDGPSTIPQEPDDDIGFLDIRPPHENSEINPSNGPPQTQHSALPWRWWQRIPRFVAHRSHRIYKGRGPPRVYVASRDTVNDSQLESTGSQQVSTAAEHHESSSGDSSEESTSDTTSEAEVGRIGCCGLLSLPWTTATAERTRNNVPVERIPTSIRAPNSDNTSTPIPASLQPPIQDILELSAVVRSSDTP